jgi:hypothetical protein
VAIEVSFSNKPALVILHTLGLVVQNKINQYGCVPPSVRSKISPPQVLTALLFFLTFYLCFIDETYTFAKRK